MKIAYTVGLMAILCCGQALAGDPIDAIQGRWTSGYGADLVISGNTGIVASQGRSGFTSFLKVGEAALEDIRFYRDESQGTDRWLVFQAKCRGHRWTRNAPPKLCNVVFESTKVRPGLDPRLGVPDDCCMHFTYVGPEGGKEKSPGHEPAAKPAAKPTPGTEQASCSARDLEGNWKRGDGAAIVVTGMDLRDGGQALMFNHPSGWPAGAFKFSNIKSGPACEYKATCQTVHRNAAGGGFNISKESCTLKYDAKAGTLSAPGTHGIYRR